MLQRLSEKHPSEFIQIAFDYTEDLVAGEALVPGSAVITVTVEKGTDGSPNTLLNGASAIVTSFDGKVGAFNVQPVKLGLDGVEYRFACLMTTTFGNKYMRQGILPVRRNTP